MKICSKCSMEKEDSLFYIQPKNVKAKLSAECKECAVERKRLSRLSQTSEKQAHHKVIAENYRNDKKEETSKRSKKHNLWKYGITLEDYRRMEDCQSKLCLICKKPETIQYRNKSAHLSVDHCHKTGKVRGLLCGSCNRALGLLRDSEEIIENALNYIRKSNET